MAKILAINGAYRDDGVTDQLVAAITERLRASGSQVDEIQLRDYPIEFCLNCRACTQQAGTEPGECVHHDNMRELVQMLEAADAFVLASPTNFGSVTAIFKRFMERLTVYGYWPWGKPAPAYRKAMLPPKHAVLISSCAAPGLLGRFVYSTLGQLRITAKLVGARPVGTLFVGLAAGSPDAVLRAGTLRKAQRLADRLVGRSRPPAAHGS